MCLMLLYKVVPGIWYDYGALEVPAAAAAYLQIDAAEQIQISKYWKNNVITLRVRSIIL